jgi:hypothetical protein
MQHRIDFLSRRTRLPFQATERGITCLGDKLILSVEAGAWLPEAEKTEANCNNPRFLASFAIHFTEHMHLAITTTRPC